MKKYLLSGLVVSIFIAYVIHQRSESTAATQAVVAPSTLPEKSPVVGTVTGKYKDGVYTGKVADAFYGNIQVKATISGGKITDVVFLDYPQDRRTSIEINTQAMPILKREAITAQSAQVDIVSGATQSSEAFRESLQSALKQAT